MASRTEHFPFQHPTASTLRRVSPGAPSRSTTTLGDTSAALSDGIVPPRLRRRPEHRGLAPLSTDPSYRTMNTTNTRLWEQRRHAEEPFCDWLRAQLGGAFEPTPPGTMTVEAAVDCLMSDPDTDSTYTIDPFRQLQTLNAAVLYVHSWYLNTDWTPLCDQANSSGDSPRSKDSIVKILVGSKGSFNNLLRHSPQRFNER